MNGKAYSAQPMNTVYHALVYFPCDTRERNDDNAHETPLPDNNFQTNLKTFTLQHQHLTLIVIVCLRQTNPF